MGLALCATGFDKTLHIGYGGFSIFRSYIAKAYSEKHGEMYSKLIQLFGGIEDDFEEKWNKDNDESLDLLLFHSDCDGVLRPKEARALYLALTKLTVDFDEDPFYTEFYKDFLTLLQHSYKRRVIIYFC